MNKAIFLDRDGTINKLRFNKLLNEYEPPHQPEKFELIDGVIDALRSFRENEYLLFVISNQPDYAKGKCSMDDLLSVHSEFKRQMNIKGVNITEYFYCYHHPNGVVPDYSYDCECRKPKPYFAVKAIEVYDIDKSVSWFIGDRDSDILCGKLAGLKTVYLTSGQGLGIGELAENIRATDLKEASELILKYNLKDYAISK